MSEPYLLIADDDPLMIRSLRIILRSTALRIEAVGDGMQALEQMRREKPALALLDVMMPRMDGLEVCRVVRADPELHDLKIFLLTARAMASERQQGLEAGASDYITKPFAKADLVARVTAAVGAPQPSEPAE
jgi:two-component system response regulator MprA